MNKDNWPELIFDDESRITEQDFRELYMGAFLPDTRMQELTEQLEEYYRLTPDSVSNKEAMTHWKAFNRWADEHGCTREEVNRAKMNARRKCSDLG